MTTARTRHTVRTLLFSSLLILGLTTTGTAADTPPAASPSRDQRELQKNICDAVKRGGFNGAMDEGPDKKRVEQLCHRFKDRYHAWPASCCDAVFIEECISPVLFPDPASGSKGRPPSTDWALAVRNEIDRRSQERLDNRNNPDFVHEGWPLSCEVGGVKP